MHFFLPYSCDPFISTMHPNKQLLICALTYLLFVCVHVTFFSGALAGNPFKVDREFLAQGRNLSCHMHACKLGAADN